MGAGGSKKEETKQPSTARSPAKTPTTKSPVKTSTTKSEIDNNRNSTFQKQNSRNEIQFPSNNRTQFDNQTLQNNNHQKSLNTPRTQWNDADIDDELSSDSEWTSKNRRQAHPTSRGGGGGTPRGGGGGRNEGERNMYNRQMNRRSMDEEYPETYAQRTARQQYTRNDLLRQKTIYRDPKDWEIEEKEQQNKDKQTEEEKEKEESKEEDPDEFNVSKFRAANRNVAPPKRDIFDMTPDQQTSRPTYDDMYGPDSYYDQERRQPLKAPTYDQTEEDLMADIEKIF